MIFYKKKQANRAVINKEGEIPAEDKSLTHTKITQPNLKLWDLEDKIIEGEETPTKLFSSLNENLLESLDTFDVNDQYNIAMQFELFKQFEDEKRQGDNSADSKDLVEPSDQPCCSKTFK